MRNSDTVYLLDASIYIFRAWFGMPDHFHDQQGRPVNAVFGYYKNLLSHLAELKPGYMVAAFDESLFSGFRHQLYPDYKANRALPDDSLAYQLALCKLLTEHAGVKCVGHNAYEADDLIAWAAHSARGQGMSCRVISRDKDLAQLVAAGESLWDWADDKLTSHDDLQQKWQIPLLAIPDLLALIGDQVDNIPGVAGIGEKTAIQLIQHFGNLESLYGNLVEVLELPIRGAKRVHNCLLDTEEEALLFRQLIRLHYPDEKMEPTEMETHTVKKEEVIALLSELGLGKAFTNLAEKYL